MARKINRQCFAHLYVSANGKVQIMQTRYGDLAIKMKNGRAVIDRDPQIFIPKSDVPKFRSKWDENFAAKCELEKRAGLILGWWYEPFSLWLPGGVRYKPDFMVHRSKLWPSIEVVEVKGWSKNRRDGITRLKIAAALFPCFTWRMVWMNRTGHFDGEYV